MKEEAFRITLAKLHDGGWLAFAGHELTDDGGTGIGITPFEALNSMLTITVTRVLEESKKGD